MEYEGDGDINSNWFFKNGAKSLVKDTGRIENLKTNQNYTDASIIKIG